jgi:hypothetical protein
MRNLYKTLSKNASRGRPGRATFLIIGVASAVIMGAAFLVVIVLVYALGRGWLEI